MSNYSQSAPGSVILLPSAAYHNDSATSHEVNESKRSIGLLSSRMRTIEEHERASLEDDMERLRSVSAPYRILPDDCLGHIFVHTIDLIGRKVHPDHDFYGRGYADYNYSSVLSASTIHRYTPWIVAQVCSRWRRVVKRVPLLWNHIIINLEKSNEWINDRIDSEQSLNDPDDSLLLAAVPYDCPMGRRTCLNKSENFLEREKEVDRASKLLLPSGLVSLKICTRTPEVYYRLETLLVRQLVQDFGSRLAHLFLHIGYHAFANFRKLHPTTFTTLKTLHLYYYRSDYDDDNEELDRTGSRMFLASAGRLQDIRLRGESHEFFHFMLKKASIPWQQIQVLTLQPDDCHPDVSVAILEATAKCSNLHTFSIGHGEPSHRSITKLRQVYEGRSPITLSSVRVLAIADEIPVERLFLLPSLETLEVLRELRHCRPYFNMQRFLNQSGCTELVTVYQEKLYKPRDFHEYRSEMGQMFDLPLRAIGDLLPNVEELRIRDRLTVQDLEKILQRKLFQRLRVLHGLLDEKECEWEILKAFECFSPPHKAISGSPKLREVVLYDFNYYSCRHEPADAARLEERQDRICRETGIGLKFLPGSSVPTDGSLSMHQFAMKTW